MKLYLISLEKKSIFLQKIVVYNHFFYSLIEKKKKK